MGGSNPLTRAEPVSTADVYDVIDVTLSLDTNAYADNDVLAAPQEVPNVFRLPGGVVMLDSIVLLDEDDQAQDIDLVFMNATGSLGAENAAVGPTDGVAGTILGIVSVAAAEYSDLANSQIATKRGLGLPLEAAAASTSLWMGAILRSGTPTYTAAGIKLKLGFRRF